MSDQTAKSEITSDDKLWAALGYPIALIALIMLLMEDKKKRPFIKFHAVQSLALNVVIWIILVIFTAVTLGFGGFCMPVVWLAFLWPAYEAYNGKYLEIPVVTDFLRKQNWV